MTNQDINTSAIPDAYRGGLDEFAHALLDFAGDNLVGLSAFGGWVVGDPFFADTPARCVAVLQRFDLKLLEKLASSGARFGQRNVAAPLMMTPDYIEASCDVFPLELLEIRQLQALILGDDHFAGLTFERKDLRLQCERECKSELIQLRQGFLATGGRQKLLAELCLACAERAVRILRGLLYLSDASPVIKPAGEVASKAAEVTNSPLPALERLVARGHEPGLAEFEGLYGEVEALAAFADAWNDKSPAGGSSSTD
jgi:hypothetical protein